MDQSFPKDRPSEVVGSLQRGRAVRETLSAHPGGLTLTETAGALGLTRAGARRRRLILAAAGYALQDGRRFRLTPRLLTVARSWLRDAGPWAPAEPIMRELAGRLQEACSAAALSGETWSMWRARPAGASSASRSRSARGCRPGAPPWAGSCSPTSPPRRAPPISPPPTSGP